MRLLLKVKDGTGPHACRLVVVGRDGSEETAGTWMEPGRGAGTFTTLGSSTMHPDQIARYDVLTMDGQRLVSVGAGR